MDVFERLLNYYSLTEERFLERSSFASSFSLPDPFTHLKGFRETLGFLLGVIAKKEKIVVSGDYDVDGMTSTAILVGALRKKGAEVGYYIPSHYSDGYGLNAKMIPSFVAKGYKVLVTVDNGISAGEAVLEAHKAGMKVVVIDHHTPAEGKTCPADFVLHGQLGGYSAYNISAAFLALLVSYGLLGTYEERYVLLAGIAVYSDAMPLEKMNLMLASKALKILSEGKYRAFNLLLNKEGGTPVTSRDVSFKIVSPLNALGRMDIGHKNNRGVAYLLSEDDNEIDALYEFISSVASQKKRLLREISSGTAFPRDSSPLGFYEYPGLPVGLTGLLANQFLDRLHKPVFVFAPSPLDPSVLSCSGRGEEGVSLYDLVLTQKDLLLTFGGHPGAVGFTLKKENLPLFKKNLVEEMKKASPARKEKRKLVLLQKEDVSFATMSRLMTFEPFGNGFPEPEFGLVLPKSDFAYSFDGRHLFVSFSAVSQFKYFSFPRSILSQSGDTVLFKGKLALDEFGGRRKAVFQAEKAADPEDYVLIG